MKKIIIAAMASVALLAGCKSNETQEQKVTEQDYIKALSQYIEGHTGEDSFVINEIREITVQDSIDYLTFHLQEEFDNIVAQKKQAWEEKLEDCKNDELANKLRHDEYMKKYEEAKRQYGNDLSHKNKIDSYLKAAQKLPATHEEYLKFDRSRSYSFTRDAENLQTEYEHFLAAGIETFASQHPLLSRYNNTDKNTVIATIVSVKYEVGAIDITEDYLFDINPLTVRGLFDHTTTNILNYDQQTTAQEAE